MKQVSLNNCESIYIRPLRVNDAKTSFKWRNNPKIWELTGSKPDREITASVEDAWIKSVLKNSNESRFAICIVGSDRYIGNVQLTGITKYKAEFHIFIGEIEYWGKGFGSQATRLILNFAFKSLKLRQVYLFVKVGHTAAIKLYEKCGFVIKEKKAERYLGFKYQYDLKQDFQKLIDWRKENS